ncbi:hypothetical protein NE562_07830 [Butyricicoccus faecihominis]|nr:MULTISPECIES: hypothetical protein [Butyricicoccaceae]MCQ5129568.1 hypothetical protein [Butyricicoccus faecihominis]WNX83926.1 hypothetical protein RWV98_15270 [Agathobaculum sp. NTUH-O15-33]
MDEPVIVNVMADGRVCDDLAAYMEKRTLPDTVRRVLEELVCGKENTETT